MIEVLVAMIILAVGLLGVAGLFANSLKSADSAYISSQAVLLAYDMGDRIRANPSALSTYTSTPPAALTKDCRNTICTTAELAQFDLYRWSTATVARELPNGTTNISIVNTNNSNIEGLHFFNKDKNQQCPALGLTPSATGNTAAVTVLWDNRKQRDNATNKSYQQGACYTVLVRL